MPCGRRQSRGLRVLACAAVTVFFTHVTVRSQSTDDAQLHAIDLEAQRSAMGYDWLRWSTRHIGHRLTGSTNGVRAEASADSLFRVAGCGDVRFVPFEAVAWQRGTVSVSVNGMDDGPLVLRSVALALTPVTASATALLVDAGNGLAADLARDPESLRGRIALINLQLIDAPVGTANLHRSEKTALAIAHGAAGVLFVNNVEGHVLLTGTASVTDEVVPIPVACISSEDGALLRSALHANKPVEANLRMTNRMGPVIARNIVATIAGTKHPEETIVVCGHLDSWDLATGATDNGIGAYSIIDLARCFSALGLKPERTIKFILFMGEEQGLLGSTALVNAWQRSGELEPVRCVINMDMSGHPEGFNVCGLPEWSTVLRSAQRSMALLDTSFHAEQHETADLHSDHQPFMLAGVPTLAPACDLGQHVYRCYHSSCDDLYLVDPQAMVDNVRRVGQLVWLLSNAPLLPGHFTDIQLHDRLVAAGLEDKLRLQKKWRW